MEWSYIDVIFFITGVILPPLYFIAKWGNNFFKNTDIKYIEPPIPFTSTAVKVLLGFSHMIDFIKNSYNKYPNERYIGLFDPTRPLILLRDIQLIKQIGIKEFESFHDHRGFVDEDADPIFGRNLFNLKGKKWRDMRATLSPAFSSSKMRNMFLYIDECAKNMAKYYIQECEKNKSETLEIEVKDAFSRYTVDVIATSAYGLKINSLEDRNNDFFELGKLTVNFSFKQLFKFVLFSLSPKISKYLKLGFALPQTSSFFRNLVHTTMKNREENKIIRYDMIHLLMEAKKGSLSHETESNETSETGFATVEESSIGKQKITRQWTDDDFAAQALIFFIGGFDTTSSLLTFFFYEVGKNQQVMKKLRNEIDSFIAESGDAFTYNDVPKLKYLDMCVSEVLRMWPPASAVDRVCSKPFTLPPPNDSSDKSYVVQKNVGVWIPIYGLQHDEKYFPNPENFDPERFSDENKSSIDPATYLPFGIGPRNCIGSRFALIVVKAVIFQMIANFDIQLSSKTDSPLKLVNSPFNLHVKNGVWVNIKPRSNKKI